MSAYDDIFSEVVGAKAKAANKYDSAMPSIPESVMTGSVMNPDYTQGMTEPQKFAAGVGKWATDRWLGAKQMVGAANSQDAKDKAALDESLVKTNTAGSLGNFAGNMIPALALPTGGIRGAAAVGFGQGLTDPVQNDGRGEGYRI